MCRLPLAALPIVAVLLLLPSPPARAETWDRVHYDWEKLLAYDIDRDSVKRQKQDGHARVIYRVLDLEIQDGCAKRSLGSCRIEISEGSCRRNLNGNCPDGMVPIYLRRQAQLELDCTGQLRQWRMDSPTEPDAWKETDPDIWEGAIERAVCDD